MFSTKRGRYQIFLHNLSLGKSLKGRHLVAFLEVAKNCLEVPLVFPNISDVCLLKYFQFPLAYSVQGTMDSFPA